MICDQCGFEHNSKGTCPKCGARVVYVNEDYEKRRQAYLEAQKKAAEGDKSATAGVKRTSSGVIVPPGVHYSTEDEHNMKTGRDRATTRYKADDEESTKDFGAVVAGAVEKVLLGIASLVVWTRKRIQKAKKKAKKKRGINNPVVTKLTFEDERNLEMDDGKETLETSKLVLSHKKFMDRRVPITAGILGGATVLIGLIVFFIVWMNTDHTKVLVYGTEGIYALHHADQILLPIEHSEESMEQYAYSNDGKVYVFVDQTHRLYIYHGKEMVSVRIDEDANYTSLMLSENGKYYILVGCINDENNLTGGELTEGDAAEGQGSDATSADETYVVYVGATDGEPVEIFRGELTCDPITITNDGMAIYRKMSTVAYGMIGEIKLESYDLNDGKKYVLADAYTDYRFVEAQNYLYYIANQKLYRVDVKNPSRFFLDDQVHGFGIDALDAYQGVLYERNAGYYFSDGSGEEGVKILSTNLQGLTFYAYADANVLCVTEASGEKLHVLKTEKGVIPKLTAEDNENAYQVNQILFVENAKALFYLTETNAYVMQIKKDGVECIGLSGAFGGMHFQAAVWSKGNYRLLNSDGRLLEFDHRGEALSDMDGVSDIWCVK